MKHSMKALISVLSLIVLLITCLTSCANMTTDADETIHEEVELWVVTSNALMKRMIENVAARFEAEHANVTIKIDAAPDNSEDKNAYLEQLRTQIMAGEGPDLFLLPSENIGPNSLIVDVNQSMRSGLWLDITDYYDKDEDLRKSSFLNAVMDVGVVDGVRYVLPLRFNFPVIYADVQKLEEHGISLADLQNGMSSLAEATQILDTGAIAAAYGDWFFDGYWMNCLSQLIDYDAQEVLLEKEELVAFLESYRTLTAYGVEMSSFPSLSNYVISNSFWTLDGQHIFLGTLENLVPNARIAKAEGIELAAIPMRASDGSLIADISYYGAIGSNTQYPDVAYAFLRQFLLEENQWKMNLEFEPIGFGWPVLLEDSGLNLDTEILEQNTGNKISGNAKTRNIAIFSAQMREEDFEILNTEPTAVCFLPATQWVYMAKIQSKLNLNYNPDAMSVNVEELADEILQELTWEVAEG